MFELWKCKDSCWTSLELQDNFVLVLNLGIEVSINSMESYVESFLNKCASGEQVHMEVLYIEHVAYGHDMFDSAFVDID